MSKYLVKVGYVTSSEMVIEADNQEEAVEKAIDRFGELDWEETRGSGTEVLAITKIE